MLLVTAVSPDHSGPLGSYGQLPQDAPFNRSRRISLQLSRRDLLVPMARSIRSLELSLTVGHDLFFTQAFKFQAPSFCIHIRTYASLVKFENIDNLPPILNAIETQNGGQKLILEVAVSKP